MYSEYPPRVRLEWVVATARVGLAAGAFLTAAISPFALNGHWALNVFLGGYLVYSVLVLALVWTPVKFGAGWDLASHLFDLVTFSALSLLTLEVGNPFYIYFIFLVVSATLRWHTSGAVWTTAAAVAVSAASTAHAVNVLHVPNSGWQTFGIRGVQLIVVAALVGYLGAYQRRFQTEIGRLVSWPRKIPPTSHALISEILVESAEILGAPRILLLWEEPGEDYLNLASRARGEVEWTHEPESFYRPVVLPDLEGRNFQAADVANERGAIIHWSAGGFRQRGGQPVNADLQRRFGMHAVQSWTLEGELIRGRLFCLDKGQMRLDDLVFGVLVARLAVSRLDSLYLVKRLREAAALDERLRVARDLHDSLLQSVAGSALQLLAARRLLDRDPEAAKKRFEDVQNQLEAGELEMRSFIRRLRPASSPGTVDIGLDQRLEELRGRIERQWDVKVKIHVDKRVEEWPIPLCQEVFRIVQEGVLNAARHADASLVRVDVSATDAELCLEIADDGRGFPFRGTYNLAALNQMNRGPLTLKERVAGLSGDLKLRSLETGTELLISIPVAKTASC
jgi:signal transduction histidine kinase